MKEIAITIGIPTATAIIGALIQMFGTQNRKPIQSPEDASEPEDINKMGTKRPQWTYGLLSGLAVGLLLSASIYILGLTDPMDRENLPIIPEPNPVPNNQLALVDSIEIPLNARDFWVETIQVRNSDTIDIHCTPNDNWTLDQDDMEPIGADGHDQQHEWALLKTANIASLIGRIGSDGEIFHIGCNKTFSSRNSGMLFITANDGPTRDDNDGTISFSINLYRRR